MPRVLFSSRVRIRYEVQRQGSGGWRLRSLTASSFIVAAGEVVLAFGICYAGVVSEMRSMEVSGTEMNRFTAAWTRKSLARVAAGVFRPDERSSSPFLSVFHRGAGESRVVTRSERVA